MKPRKHANPKIARGMANRLKIIARRLKREYGAERVVLYGSYATGRVTADSDVDLMIVADTTEPLFRRMAAVKQLLRDVRGGWPIAPLVFTPREFEQKKKARDPFLLDILKSGLPL